MLDVRTKNLILKRKHSEVAISVKKYIAGTDITNRSVWNAEAPILNDEIIEIDDSDSNIEENLILSLTLIKAVLPR